MAFTAVVVVASAGPRLKPLMAPLSPWQFVINSLVKHCRATKDAPARGEQSRLPRGPPLPEKSINQNLFISSFIGNVVRLKNYNYISNKLCFSIYLSISISGNLRPKEKQPGFCIYNRHMGRSKLRITVVPSTL